MGYIRHNAIVATAWDESLAKTLFDFASRLGANPLISEKAVNGYVTVVIPPDGSKEGWASSDDGDLRREEIVKLLMSAGFEWLEVAYGWDDGSADVVRSAWSK